MVASLQHAQEANEMIEFNSVELKLRTTKLNPAPQWICSFSSFWVWQPTHYNNIEGKRNAHL